MLDDAVKLIDYGQTRALNPLFPEPPVLSSHNSKWTDVHFELHHQPAYDTTEHQNTRHVIVNLLAHSSGERWLDGRFQTEIRHTGDIAIVPAGALHRCQWQADAQFMLLAIDPSFLKQVGLEIVNPDQIELIPQFATPQDALIQGILSALRNELESGGIGGSLFVDHLKTTFALHLLRRYCTSSPQIATYTDGLSKSKLRQVLEYINEHLDQEIKLAELAKLVEISPYHFLRLFKQSIGVTPHQYILQRRIDQAKHLLLHSESSISDVAIRVGFFDQSHFTRYFKRVVGVTPKQLLQSERKNLPSSSNFLQVF